MITFNLFTAFIVGSGGFIGAISRYWISTFVANHYHSTFPTATLLVNLLGSFLIGILFAIFTNFGLSGYLKLFLITGFLGALTTYSTFAFETYILIADISFKLAILNITLNLFGSITLVAIGYKLFLKI